MQHQKSQRANSIFTNKVFRIIYSFLSILEKPESQGTSPVPTSKHPTVGHEFAIFSEYLNTIRENLTTNNVSQNVKHDFPKILAWFIINYFTHNLDLISHARQIFRLQNSTDDTVLAEESDYVWVSEWSHLLFINILTEISSQAFGTISKNKDYVKIYPLTTDATLLNYNSILPDRTGNNSLNSTVIQQENLNGTRNLTQQDIQTSSRFAKEEVVTTVVTTAQQNISPIHPNLTTPRPKNPTLPQVTLQSTVKHTIKTRYPHVSYQLFRPMMKPIKKTKNIH